MPTKVRVCGLMLAYFKAEMTEQCLQTLVDQGIERIILVDNSADVVENQRTLALATRFPAGWLHVIISPQNLGFAKGMNLALQHARECGTWDYFLVLNNDINAQPQLVQQLTEYMQQHQTTTLLGVKADTGNGIQGGLYYQRLTGLMFRKPIIGSFQVVSGCCLMLRAHSTPDTLFDPHFFMYGEDVELSWRLQNQGSHILNKVLLTHTPSQSSQEGSFFYEYHINRGHWLLVETLGSNALERALMYTLRLLLLTVRAGLRSWRFRCFLPLKALLLVGLGLPIRPSTHH